MNAHALNLIAVADHARFTEMATRFGWSDDEQLAVAEFVGDAQENSFTNGQHALLPD
jgi:hypothetical protein